MPTPLPPSLQLPLELEFTAEEIHAHCEPSPFLRQLMESMMAKSIKARLEIKYDPDQPLLFAQEEAYQKARFQLLHELLNLQQYYPLTAPAKE